MAHDAFISYSIADKPVADAACAALESAGVRCWIAPRDVPPGSQWASAIVGGIDCCRVMVLIFSSRANVSHQIHREVERAVSKGVPVIPLRIEDVAPTSSMEYFLGAIHWLDALTPPLETHLQRLIATAKSCIGLNQAENAAPAPGPAPAGGPSVQKPSPPSRRTWAAALAACLLVAVCGGGLLAYLKYESGAKESPVVAAATAPAVAPAAAGPVKPSSVPTAAPAAGVPAPVSPPSAAPMPLSAAQERALKPLDSFRECADCPEMVVVPAGGFAMGSPPTEPGHYDNESPLHTVTISKPFAVGKLTVTADQFAAFVAETGHEPLIGCYTLGDGKIVMASGLSWRNPGFAQGGSQPAVCVSWSDAKLYVAWLSGKTGKAYRLPTEAEWEYAARAGTTTRYLFGDVDKDLCRYGNGFDLIAKSNLDGTEQYPAAPCSDGYIFTAPVGSFLPNAFGLYDMIGNINEWTEDCAQPNYLGAPTDGSAWTSGNCDQRIFRSGSWANGPRELRVAWRLGVSFAARGDGTGFRVVRTLGP